MASTISVRRSYVDECERFWRNASVKWDHKDIHTSKTLSSESKAKEYIDTMVKIWNIRGKYT